MSNSAYDIPVFSSARQPNIKDRQPLHYAQGATLEHINEALESSAAAFQKWKRVLPIERRQILLNAANLLKRKRNDGIEIQMLECSPDKNFAAKMYDDAILHLTEAASLVTSVKGTVPISETSNVLPFVFREPIGPVLGIAPWNAAPVLAMRSFGLPIAAGCTSIFKTSEFSPASQFFVAEALIDAGLPDGVLNVLHIRPEDAAEYVRALIASRHVRKVNFTGSNVTGRKIAVAAAEHFKPTLLELGGKAASVVCEDANLEKAVSQIIVGAWLNQGQICMSTERVFVHKSVYGKFIELLKAAASNLSPVFGGYPQIAPHYADRVNTMIAEAIDNGATLLYGQKEKLNDATLSPTILTDVDPNSPIYAEETFGPTMIVILTGSDLEAVELVNESRYGLTASVWTENIVKGFSLARDIESGAVHINGMTVHDQSTLPHGGVKDSGYGRFGSNWGLDEFTVTKTVTISGFDGN
ncbi:vanillin dehydrogenase [Lipomyces arxii]|uniref:vanillin dehydrogenase n=1 Tax=Lipomyces arxii TaxID=56418 RepID=UPI0034CF3A2D